MAALLKATEMATYYYQCPGCHRQYEFRKRVTLIIRRCPHCGIEITIEEIDRQEAIRVREEAIRRRQAVIRRILHEFIYCVIFFGLLFWLIVYSGLMTNSPAPMPKPPAPMPKPPTLEERVFADCRERWEKVKANIPRQAPPSQIEVYLRVKKQEIIEELSQKYSLTEQEVRAIASQ